MVAVPGYSYETFCRGIYERDGAACWIRGLLEGRGVSGRLLDCDGQLDGHHAGLSKSWLKREYPNGGFALYRVGNGDWIQTDDEDYHWPLASMLNDPRNGVCACRRHHDLVERHLIVVRRADLPEHVEEFAAELGDKALARLERDFGPFPTSLIELGTDG